MHRCWNSMQNSVFAEVITSYLAVIAKLASMDNSIGLVPRRLGYVLGRGVPAQMCLREGRQAQREQTFNAVAF